MRFFLIFCGLIALVACKHNTANEVETTTYFCGAEEVGKDEDGQPVFTSENMLFRAPQFRTNVEAFEGEFSVKLTKDQLYGMTFILTGVEKGEYISASIWQKENAAPDPLICTATGNANFVLTSTASNVYESRNGWRKHSIRFKAVTDLDSLTFFAFAGGDNDTSYFDNLEVVRYPERPDLTVDYPNVMEIDLPDSSKKKLNKYVKKAIREEIIRDKYKKYVAGALLDGNEEIPVELRLKGDWTDHLVSGNVSYRIKTASGYAYDGLRSFSIQHPNTRNYLNEWFMHELFDREDLLSTRYAFLPVRINEAYQGVYALEEHFDKQLLESRMRREGPILKIDEEGFWALAVAKEAEGLEIEYPFYESAYVSCFKINRTLKSPTLSAQFFNGAALLDLFKNRYPYPELIFDMEQLGAFYALMDLGNIQHALAWHNRRFYYNPVTAKIEHIGFDMIPMGLPYYDLLATAHFKMQGKSDQPEAQLNDYIFANDAFREAYTRYLKKFSSETYLDSVFMTLDAEIKNYETLMNDELPGYVFNRDLYYGKAEKIREELKTLDALWDAFMADEHKLLVPKKMYASDNGTFYVEEISINPYRSEQPDGTYLVQMDNFHATAVNVLGFSVKPEKDSLIPLDVPIALAGFDNLKGCDTASIILPYKPTRIFFEVANRPGEMMKKKFIKWHKPTGHHPRIELYSNFKPQSPYYRMTGNKLVFKKGAWQLDELIYVPEGIEVTLEAGTTIDCITGGGLIFNDNVTVNGTSELPVYLTSSDSSGQGMTVLQADSVSINHLTIENMNTLNYKGWTLTGALTIYESGVYIRGLKIVGNQCEDGLNIIRSNFDVADCFIANTYSDGFDADFCTGDFSASTFENTGNDCIDFSGSVVRIMDVEIHNSGDKGVSAGERSALYLNNITIDGALTGLASKDDSYIDAENVTVKSAEVGVAAFQKKPEYAGSQMLLENCFFDQLNQLGLIEAGSKIKVDGEIYEGHQKFDIEQMYARFEKK